LPDITEMGLKIKEYCGCCYEERKMCNATFTNWANQVHGPKIKANVSKCIPNGVLFPRMENPNKVTIQASNA
jgi:hypothetical protein